MNNKSITVNDLYNIINILQEGDVTIFSEDTSQINFIGSRITVNHASGKYKNEITNATGSGGQQLLNYLLWIKNKKKPETTLAELIESFSKDDKIIELENRITLLENRLETLTERLERMDEVLHSII